MSHVLGEQKSQAPHVKWSYKSSRTLQQGGFETITWEELDQKQQSKHILELSIALPENARLVYSDSRLMPAVTIYTSFIAAQSSGSIYGRVRIACGWWLVIGGHVFTQSGTGCTGVIFYLSVHSNITLSSFLPFWVYPQFQFFRCLEFRMYRRRYGLVPGFVLCCT